MQLYLIHCGFYDEEISEGIYEFHVNIPVAADSLESAKARVRQEPIFVKKRMHIDGIQEIKAVSGLDVKMVPGIAQATNVQAHLHRDF